MRVEVETARGCVRMGWLGVWREVEGEVLGDGWGCAYKWQHLHVEEDGDGRGDRVCGKIVGGVINGRARVPSQLTRSSTAHIEFMDAQSNVQGRFERGEGGSVT